MKNEQMTTFNQEGLSKKERRRLKKEQKQIKRDKEVKKKLLVKWGVVLGTVVLLAIGFFLFKNIKAKRYENAPKIQITPAAHNFGEISASQGIVEIGFEIKNVGISTLTITGMETSCGCTTAKLKVGDKESPTFGMHDNPADWSTSLKPDETAILLVIFDPNFHKNTFGPVTRTISIFSDDPGESKKETIIYANVIK